MMTRTSTAILLTASLSVFTVTAAPLRAATYQDHDKRGLSSDAENFLKRVMEDSYAEIAKAKLAQTQSNDPQVKELGKKIQADHEKANQDLEALAASKGVKLPSKASNSDLRAIDAMADLSGDQFDRGYLGDTVRDHRSSIELFEKFQKDSDPDVAKFATNSLPMLKQHLEQADALRKK
jgi:putative membrane protein